MGDVHIDSTNWENITIIALNLASLSQGRNRKLQRDTSTSL